MIRNTPARGDSADCDDAAAAYATARYVVRLCDTGTTPHATRAILNFRKNLRGTPPGAHELEIVDIVQNSTLVEGEQIIAAPTLIKKLPLPLRRFIGDLSHTEKILLGLDLRGKGTRPE